MKAHPIIMSGAMVRAILDGHKTQTRRVIKYRTYAKQGTTRDANAYPSECPYGQPGDRLWIRETWKCAWTIGCGHGLIYRADDFFRCFNGCHNNLIDGEVSGGPLEPGYNWIVKHYSESWLSSRFMPRWASRLTLEIVNVSVEQVQKITFIDAKSEGVNYEKGYTDPRDAFRRLWDSINEKRGFGWDKNPWVWVIEFKQV